MRSWPRLRTGTLALDAALRILRTLRDVAAKRPQVATWTRKTAVVGLRVGAAFRLCQLRSSSLMGNSVLPAGYSQGYSLSESLIVLMGRANWRSATMASKSSALWGFASLVAESRIRSSSRRFGTLPSHLIVPTDRRCVRYRTYCISRKNEESGTTLIWFDRLKLI